MRKQKVGNHEEIRNVTWIPKAGSEPSHYEKLKNNHDFFNVFMKLICNEHKEDEEQFKAERAFYHLNPEE